MPPKERKNLPAVLEPLHSRTVGIRVGNKVYAPILSDDANAAMATAGVLEAHARAVIAMDRVYAAIAAYAAHRTVIWKPAEELAAAHREETELLHQDALAEKRREKELHEADLATLEAKHRLEAAAQFKEYKFQAGEARFAEKIAQRRVGEAVARAGLHDPEANEPKSAAPPASKEPSILDHLAARAQELDEQIEQAEAAGKPTDRLRAELDILNGMLRREILKAGR